ncbi:hypothetical protein NVP1121O_006 [Vibrio phage 1.121.O._10N.286.46.C4]|nr:hypothetical protein NVP1121O_006 [Vibrio phage 1.121.O._10N.286.46.C4]
MINWLKRKLGIPELEAEVEYLNKYVETLEKTIYETRVTLHSTNALAEQSNKLIQECTQVSADISLKGNPSQVILTGRFRNKDYVSMFNVRDSDMEYLVKLFRDMETQYGRGFYDAPFSYDVKGWIDR